MVGASGLQLMSIADGFFCWADAVAVGPVRVLLLVCGWERSCFVGRWVSCSLLSGLLGVGVSLVFLLIGVFLLRLDLVWWRVVARRRCGRRALHWAVLHCRAGSKELLDGDGVEIEWIGAGVGGGHVACWAVG